MASTNPRNSHFPKNALLMVSNTSGNIPVGYTQETSLNCKYIKGIATVCTNPNVASGGATHTHSTGGAHATHTSASSTAHTHTQGTSGPSGTISVDTFSAGYSTATAGHSHTVTSASGSPVATGACGGGHTHGALTNSPVNRTVSFYKHTETSLGLRRSSLPPNTLLFNAVTTLPSGFTTDCTYDCKLIKGASTSGTNGGCATHTHAADLHTHSFNLASHSHAFASHGGGAVFTPRECNGTGAAPGAHTHAAGSLTFAANTGTAASSSAGSHTHDAIDLTPSYKTLRIILNSSVKLRRPAMQKDMVALWLCPVACIPSGYAVSNGSNGTINLLSLYARGKATAGCAGGSNTHTHSCVGPSHSHTATPSHTHTGSGTSGGAGSVKTRIIGADTGAATSGHTHSIGGCSSSSGSSLTSSCNAFGHTHGSQNHEPSGVTVAFIQKV